MREYNLTRRQKIFLEEQGLNPDEWRRLNESATELIIKNKFTGKVQVIRK